MNEDTVRALDGINRRFYRERAGEFNQTRERAWRGWETLFERVGETVPAAPTVLDLGCGNGRFARFLARKRETFVYEGVDASPLALRYARDKLSGLENVRLWQHDFVTGERILPTEIASERFDLVVLFGVLHHVPGTSNRRRLLSRLAARLAPNGLLAYTVWRFDRFERFSTKLVPWDTFSKSWPEHIDPRELEPGDHIMTWGSETPSYRYVHAASDEEMEALAAAIPLSVVESFLGDDALNRYWVFINEEER